MEYTKSTKEILNRMLSTKDSHSTFQFPVKWFNKEIVTFLNETFNLNISKGETKWFQKTKWFVDGQELKAGTCFYLELNITPNGELGKQNIKWIEGDSCRIRVDIML